jgi:ribosomal protein S18 acetylase RimI-like enzyme
MKNNFNLPSGLTIRPARDSDKVFISTLYRAVRNDLRLVDAEEDFVEMLIEQQHHAQTVGYGEMFPDAMYFIVEKHTEKIGRIVVDFGMNDVRLVDLAFIPVAQGKGYGSEVIQMLQQAAAVNRVPLTLSVMTHNYAAKALYVRLGFVLLNDRGTHEEMVWYPPLFYAPITG